MWLEGGASANKVLLGTPLYGRNYRLLNNDQHDLGSPTGGPGDAGRYTQEAGSLAYYEVRILF